MSTTSNTVERAVAELLCYHDTQSEDTTPRTNLEISSIRRGKLPANEWVEDLHVDDADPHSDAHLYSAKVIRWLDSLQPASEDGSVQDERDVGAAMTDHVHKAISASSVGSPISKDGRLIPKDDIVQHTELAESVTTIDFQRAMPASSDVTPMRKEERQDTEIGVSNREIGISIGQGIDSLQKRTRHAPVDLHTPDQVVVDLSSLALSTPCPAPRPRVPGMPIANQFIGSPDLWIRSPLAQSFTETLIAKP